MYILIEFQNSKPLRLARHYESLSNSINPTKSIKPQYNNTIVTFNSKKIRYPKIHESNFNFTFYSALLKRSVEYCQWVPPKNSHSMNSLFGISYRKKWVREPIELSDSDSDINNPIDKSYDTEKIVKPTFVGNISISKEIYAAALNRYYYKPSIKELEQYKSSSAYHEGFVYLDRGYFYKTYESDLNITKVYNRYRKGRSSSYSPSIFKNLQPFSSIAIQLGFNLISPVKFFEFSNIDNMFHNIQGDPLSSLFQDCQPGDVRIRFYVYNPKKSTFIGILKDGQLKPLPDGMNSIYPDFVPLRELLLCGKDLYQSYMIIIRVVMAITTFLIIIFKTTGENSLYRTKIFFAVGFIVLIIKSFFQNYGFLKPKICISALLLLLALPLRRFLNLN